MSISFTLKNNDIYLEKDRLAVVLDDEQIAQSLLTRLRFYRGEYPLDSRYGFPYREMLGSRTINIDEMESEFKRYILNTQGVSRISMFRMEMIGRTLQVSFSVETITGREINIALEPVGSTVKVNNWRLS